MSTAQSWPKTLYLCPECGQVYVRSDHLERLLTDSVKWCSGGDKGGPRHERPVRCEPVLVAPLDRPPGVSSLEHCPATQPREER